MEYKIEKAGYNVKIELSLNAEEWEKAIEAAYQKTKGKYKLQGFRPGKAPRKMIEKYYGEGVFLDEAFYQAFPPAYDEVCTKEKLDPIEQPDVDIDEIGENGIRFAVRVVVRPEVKLGAYKGLTISHTVHKATEEEVNQRIEAIQNRNARKVDVTERSAQNGDFALIDYSGSVDGVKFEGGTATGHELELGSNSFIEGFEEQVIGMNIGEEKDIKVTFPTEYHSNDLAGKDAVFAIKLHSLKTKEVPKLDDDFAKDVSDFDTFEEYKNDIRASLEKSAEQRTDVEKENKMLDAIANNATIDIPPILIEQQIDHFVEDFSYRLSQQGMKLEDYLKYTKSTKEQMRDSRRKEAEHAVKLRLVIEEVITTEKIEIKEEDINAELEKPAEAAKQTIDEYKKTIGDRNMRYLLNDILMKKVLDMLKASNTFVEAGSDDSSQAEPKAEKKAKTTKAKAKAKADDKGDEKADEQA